MTNVEYRIIRALILRIETLEKRVSELESNIKIIKK